jgi:hypothetical protein
MTLRRSVFQRKARLLKAVRSELQAAKGGLTWRVIWGTLRDEGYPVGYQQFCKAANRVIEGAHSSTAGNGENLPPRGKRDSSTDGSRERSEQREHREEGGTRMANTERRGNGEAGSGSGSESPERERESRLQPTKVFKPSVFVGRSED